VEVVVRRRDLAAERRRVLWCYERGESVSKLDELGARYAALAHAMQSGVAYSMEKDPKETTPKHLRVGINCAMSDQGSLVRLLIAKGLITEEEYMEALVEGMEAEVKSYEQKIRDLYGGKTKITLG
jgi:hypothetical protein